MIKKLKQNKGESLIEALISMLIAVLAMGLITTAALVATRMNHSNRENDQKFSKELEQVEIYMAETVEKDMTISFSDGTTETVTVEVYGGDGKFASFKQEDE